MKLRLILPLVLLLLSHASLLQADQVFESKGQPPLLVELYTSEGCSSCPPADQKAASLLQHQDLWRTIVPVVFHVDYWDYLGWKDRFAQSGFSHRQRLLKQKGQLRAVYTPGWLVDGKEWRGYFQGRSMPKAATRDGGELRVIRKGSHVEVEYSQNGDAEGPFEAHLVVLGFDYTTEVKRGENSGLDLEHQFVVLHKQHARGSSQWHFELPEKLLSEIGQGTRKALALWINQEGRAEPLQVLGGWIK